MVHQHLHVHVLNGVTLLGFTDALFALNSDTGEITVAPGIADDDLDQETQPNSYELIVGVADSGSPSLRGGT